MLDIYKNRKVFLTGHTGFKGGWLTLWLKSIGAEVFGYSLLPETKPSLYNAISLQNYCDFEYGNILDFDKLTATMQNFKPEVVFHLAAQPIVRRSYNEPILTYQTNVMGSLNVLEAARKSGTVKAFVNITTDKCYENLEIVRGYVENDPMGGYDMYSSSKGCVEIMTASYRRSFLANDFALATARAGNVVGGGDWAPDRLIPDCVKALEAGQKIELRNPQAIRPWQHVLEPLSGYLLLGAKLLLEGHKYAESFNFGPQEKSIKSVEDIVNHVIHFYGRGKVVINKKDDLHEANILMLNIEKAKKVLGWQPVLSAKEAIEKTIDWYKAYYEGCNMYEFTLKQIMEFSSQNSFIGS